MIRHSRPLSPLVAAAVAVVVALGLVGASTAAGAPSSNGTLHISTRQPIPGSNQNAQLVVAEADNGDVAIAVSPTSTNDNIEVAKVGHKPKLFLTVPHGTVGLAFNKRLLFIAGPHAISSVDRKTRKVIRTWQVKVKGSFGSGKTMVYGDGRLWVLGSDGHGAKVLEINPASAKVKAVGSGHNVVTIAAGPLGVYFVRGGGHTLVRVAATGKTITAPTHQTVSETLSGPAAVHPVVVDGSDLLVAHDYGQGLDASLIRYNATTLAHLTDVGTNVTVADNVVPTVDGDRVLLDGEVGKCSSLKPCVALVNTTTAKTSHAVRLGGVALSRLVGPDPAVVVARGHHADLVRLTG